MTDIFVDPSKNKISLRIKSESLHIIGFVIDVFAKDGNTKIEEHSGDTRTNNPMIIDINQNPSTYKGTFIRGTFTAISPDGTDYNYNVEFALLEDGTLVNPTIDLTGPTQKGQETFIAIFHIN